MGPVLALTGYVLATALGAYCATCIIRGVPALMARDHGPFNRFAVRAMVSGAACIGLAAVTRRLTGI